MELLDITLGTYFIMAFYFQYESSSFIGTMITGKGQSVLVLSLCTQHNFTISFCSISKKITFVCQPKTKKFHPPSISVYLSIIKLYQKVAFLHFLWSHVLQSLSGVICKPKTVVGLPMKFCIFWKTLFFYHTATSKSSPDGTGHSPFR